MGDDLASAIAATQEQVRRSVSTALDLQDCGDPEVVSIIRYLIVSCVVAY